MRGGMVRITAHSAKTLRRRLHLTAALRAKGKEFDLVVLWDCNRGIWPGKPAKTEAELEAERRVFYAALTRAKKRLVLVVDRSIAGELLMPTPYWTEMGLKITGSLDA
jgi:DNA helicase-2/ATP-dependent DNA helicase PcrA